MSVMSVCRRTAHGVSPAGPSSVVTCFEGWVATLCKNTELESLKDNLILNEVGNNIHMVIQRTAVFQLRQEPILSYPIGEKAGALNTVQCEFWPPPFGAGR